MIRLIQKENLGQYLTVSITFITLLELNILRGQEFDLERIGFSHLKEHKFKHSFQDPINPMYSCGNGIETTIHFFLYCANFNNQRQTLFDKITFTNATILTENEDSNVHTILFATPSSKNSFNRAILSSSIEIILLTERFNNPLF